MRDITCDQEQAVISAIASGQMTSQLQTHVDTCPSCRDALVLTRALKELAGAANPALPPAGYVWWESRLRQRRALRTRVTRFISISHTATVGIAIIGLAVWIVWHRSEVSESIGSLMSFSVRSSSSLASSAVPLIYLSLALLFVNAVLTVRAVITNRKSQ